MAKELWLPNGHKLPNGSRILSLQYSGAKWQIFDTDGSDNILLVRPDLVQKWNECGFLGDSLFEEIVFGNDSFWTLNSHKKYALTPIENGQSPENKVDALALALALKASRDLSEEVSFHDAIYVEQYSRLLPVWTLTSYVEDEVVLGTWITGGVVISTESFRRLRNLTGWMPANDLAEIVAAAGLTVPSEAGLLAKRKPAVQSKKDEKITTARKGVQFDHPNPVTDKNEPKTFKLPGRPQLEEFFNEHIIDIIFNAEKYQLLGIEFPSAVVLHGPPGCGKTFAVERLVEFIDWPNYSIDSGSIGSPYIHETGRKISEMFDTAIDNAPSVIIIDEMESFLADRKSGSLSGQHRVEEVAEFLRRIPEAINNKVLIIAMTNMIETIDPAILRRGRFDHIIAVGMPSREETSSLIDSLLSKLPTSDNLDLGKIIDALTGRALSDSAFVIREAARLAAKADKMQLDQESIEAALNSLPQDAQKTNRPIGFIRDSK